MSTPRGVSERSDLPLSVGLFALFFAVFLALGLLLALGLALGFTFFLTDFLDFATTLGFAPTLGFGLLVACFFVPSVFLTACVVSVFASLVCSYGSGFTSTSGST